MKKISQYNDKPPLIYSISKCQKCKRRKWLKLKATIYWVFKTAFWVFLLHVHEGSTFGFQKWFLFIFLNPDISSANYRFGNNKFTSQETTCLHVQNVNQLYFTIQLAKLATHFAKNSKFWNLLFICLHTVVQFNHMASNKPNQIGEIGNCCFVPDVVQHKLVIHCSYEKQNMTSG